MVIREKRFRRTILTAALFAGFFCLGCEMVLDFDRSPLQYEPVPPLEDAGEDAGPDAQPDAARDAGGDARDSAPPRDAANDARDATSDDAQ